MNKLLKSYILPHAPVIIPKIGAEDHIICRKTYRGVDKIGQEIADLKPKRIVVVTPHGPLFSDAIAVLSSNQLRGDFTDFGCDNIELNFNNDLSFVNKLQIDCSKKDIYIAKVNKQFAKNYDVSADVDYGALVPLYFVNQYYQQYEVVVITYGLLSVLELYTFGTILRNVIEQTSKSTVFIASGDMAHTLVNSAGYIYNDKGSRYDFMVQNVLTERDIMEFVKYPLKLVSSARTCSYHSLSILFGMYDKKIFDAKIYSYEHPFGVGYLSVGIDEMVGIAPSLMDEIAEYDLQKKMSLENSADDYIKLARDVVVYYTKYGRRPLIDSSQYKIENKKAACFVSIYNTAGLRGCVGTVEPVHSDIVQEIISNTIAAATTDERFTPVTSAELSDLRIVVDVVASPEKIKSFIELDVKRYGLIVRKEEKIGVILPDLPDITSSSKQINVALRKAGIDKFDYYDMYRFEVERHEVEI